MPDAVFNRFLCLSVWQRIRPHVYVQIGVSVCRGPSLSSPSSCQAPPFSLRLLLCLSLSICMRLPCRNPSHSLFACVSANTPACLVACPLARLFADLLVYMSACPFVCPRACLLVCLLVCQPFCLFVCPVDIDGLLFRTVAHMQITM